LARFKLRVAGITATAVALTLVAAAVAGGVAVKVTLTGTCVQTNKLDGNGVLVSSTVTCDATGTCKCLAGTTLAYHVVSRSPGTGADGREQGRLTATSAEGTVRLSLLGVRTAAGVSTGKWTLGRTTGFHGLRFRSKGSYTMTARTTSNPATASATSVRISATVGCWQCPEA
jgi:hypothetical protein